MRALRQTLVKAFSAPAGRKHSVLEPGVPQGHAQALGRFFRNLEEAFGERGALPQAAESGGEQASCVRAIEGLEFVIETPRGVFRFHNSLHGAVSAGELLGNGVEETVELLGVECRNGSYVPIRKAAGGAGRMGNYSFTSIAALVDEYMDAARTR